MPTLWRTAMASFVFLPISVPSTVTVPAVGLMRPLRIWTSVDLPEPV